MTDTSELFDLLQLQSAGAWKWNLETDYIEFDKVWRNVLGFTSAQIDHDINFWLSLLHPDESVSIRNEVFRCRDGTIPLFHGTHRLRMQDKNWITVHSLGARKSNEDKTDYFLCVQFIVDDSIEGIKQKLSGTTGTTPVEKRIKAGKNIHETLLEKIKYPILAVDKSMGLLYGNEAMDLVPGSELIKNIGSDPGSAGELPKVLLREFKQVFKTGMPQQITAEYEKHIWKIAFSSIPDGAFAVMQDITDFEKARERFDFKSRFESLLIDISTGFIEMRGNALNLGINDALMEIGISIHADRAYLFQIDNVTRTVSNTHEWCASNIRPRIDNQQNIPFNSIPWWMYKLRRLEIIDIHDVFHLSGEAAAEKEILEQRDIQSLLAIPIVHRDSLIGFLGFDSARRKRTWSEDIIDLLRIAGDAMGNALERNRMDIRLRNMYRKADEEARMNAVLLREVNHRVKNNLSEIIGLLYAQMKYTERTKSIDDFVPSLIGRVQGLATVHSMLSMSGWKPLKITELARQIVSNTISVKPGGQRVFSTIPDSDVKVNSRVAHSLALIFNELVRNSIKYAFEGNKHLRISLKVQRDDSGNIEINYSDNGSGFPDEVLRMQQSGLGIDIIKNMVSKNLQGELNMLNNGGATTEILFTENREEQ